MRFFEIIGLQHFCPFPRGTWALIIEAGRCGLVVIASACGVRTQARISPQTVVLITMATVICILGHGLQVLTAVPKT